MLPFDSKGEYTPEEVKSALAGINGTRQLSFRYERLNSGNAFLGHIDYVSKCSIENNSLADIKRTAKFDILDTGTINYLQDRIKPYIRLEMPADQTYADIVESFDPDIWWKLDDPNVLQNIYNPITVPDGTTYQTSTAPYFGTTDSGNAYTVKLQSDAPGVHRSEAWIAYEITTSEALSFNFKGGASTSTAGTNTFYILTAPDLETTPVETGYTTDISMNGVSTNTVIISPKRGYVFVRIVSTATGGHKSLEVSAEKRTRIEDSSKNKLQAYAVDYIMGQPPLVGGGTSAKVRTGSTLTNANRISTDRMIELPHQDAYVVNLWASMDQTFLDVGQYSGKIEVYTSNISEWYHYIQIQPSLSSSPDVTFIIWQNGYYAEMLVPKSKVTGKHMFTVVYEPLIEKMQLFIDGVFHDNFIDVALDPLSLGVKDFHENNIQLIEVDAYTSAGTVYLDDVSIFAKPVAETTISALYARGLQSGTAPKRSGYVEWPQGVFVLSSPTRTMEDGNVVTREVEGYDQLVTLKEDSFDYRYSVKAGSVYTDAIYEVLQSAKTLFSMPTTESYWSLEGNAKITSSNSIRLDTVDANYASAVASGFALRGIQISARIDAPTTPSTATTFMQINYYTDPTASGVMLRIEKEGSTIKFNVDGHAYVETWNAVNDAYWRMRESGGFFYFETSANRVTWAVRRKIKLGVPTYIQANIQLTADHGQALVGSGFNELSATGYAMVIADITKSSAKLPTAMEWEPGTPKLTIINDLLAAINYQSATYSEGGNFLGRPYISPANRTPQYRYATDAESVITGDVDQTVDMFAVPNKWIVVVSDPDRPMLVGEYVNDDPHSPTSTVSRGRTIVDYRTEQSAPDQLTLDAQAARLAFEASQVYEAIEFDTAIMPIHQNNDVYELAVDGLEIDGKYSEISWSMELKNGATMSHKVRKVVSV